MGEAGEGVPAPEADLEGLSLRHPNHKTGTTQKVHAGLGSFGGRISDLPEDVRKHLDAYAEKYGVDVAGMDADLDAAFSDAKAVESGRDWYEKEFHQNASALAEKYGFTDEQAVGVIAITSARTFWETGNGRKPNLELAERFMDAERNGPAKGLSAKEAGARYSNGYIPGRGFAENAYALLKGEQTPQEAVTGAKRSSFYNNGANPSTSRDVTVDVFMGAYMAKNSDRPLKSVQSDLSAKPPQYLTKQGIACSPAYLIIADAILRASDRHAAEVGYTVPSQTQAAAWVYAKDNFSLKELGA